jgi:hypothetical protein
MTDAFAEAASNTDRFYTVIKSMGEFDKAEVKGVIDNLLSPTPRDTCFVGTYYRVIGNVESLLRMEKSKDYQAIAMLSRALFELAADLRLLEVIPDGWARMIAFVDLDKLRLAEKIIQFKKDNPNVEIKMQIYEDFVTKRSSHVLGLKKSLWPGKGFPRHWSNLNLAERAAKLKAPFDQMYAEDYGRISWYAHPGLTGVWNVPAIVFIYLCAYAFNLAAKAYEQSLHSMIREFKLDKANDKIEKLLELSKQLPFTDSPEQVEVLTRKARG